MSAQILDGKACAAEVKYAVLEGSGKMKVPPRLLIVTDGKDPASQVYIRNKLKAADECGIETGVFTVEDTWVSNELLWTFSELVDGYDGVIIQLPFENHEVRDALFDQLPPAKDVDGLLEHPQSHTPCTPKGIITLLDHYDIPIAGKNVVIIGRSKLVGRPLAELFLQRDATVTVCHSKTTNLEEHTRNADILVAAVGKPNTVTADMVKPGAVVVDVGINRVDDKLCGDVDFENVKEVADWITPVPGGVGPMTVASLMQNTLEAAK